MKTTFVNFKAEDGVKLQGLLFEPNIKGNTIIIHIHGMAGSFYENSFITSMAELYSSNNVAFLSFNNRGHDYIADIVKITPDGTESVLGGAAYEIIEESLLDIEGAISFVKELGYDRIVLQGHSSGANKIAYSYSIKQLDAIGVALLSPCDDLGILIDEVGEKRNEYLKLADTLISDGKPEAFMPEDTFFSYLLSAKTYKDSFCDNSALDAFPYRDENNDFSMFKKISVPILITFGNDGDYLLQPHETIKQLLNEKKSPDASLDFEVIEGASHSYSGKETILAETILQWMNKLDG